MRQTAALWLVCACLILGACSSRKFIHVWNERYLVASRLHDDGEHEKAQQHYDQLLKHAPDEETRRLTQYKIALLRLDQGRPEEAKRLWQALIDEPIKDEYGARAMYHIIRMEPSQDERVKSCRALILRYPEHVPAEHCLHDLRRYWVAQGSPVEFIKELKGLGPSVQGSELYDYTLFLSARAQDEDVHDEQAALKGYEALYAHDSQGPLADDALWERAQIYKRQGKWQEALEVMSRLVKDVETSWFVGTYESEFADDARYQMGLIHKEQLKDYDQAIDQFDAFMDEFPTSLLRDDAAWQIVECQQLKGSPDLNALLVEFIKDYPESRHVRRAQALLGEPQAAAAP